MSEPDWVRRRRLAEVFGDVLPETTQDENAGEAGDRPHGSRGGSGDGGETAGDRWLRDQVPPHHGTP